MNNLTSVPKGLSLDVVPQPEICRQPIKDRYGYSTNEFYHITPYDRADWVARINELGLIIPFDKIVTMDQGRSVCRDCGAVYAGYNYNGCEAVVYKTDPNDRWNSRYTFSHLYHRKNVTERCGGTLKWDLQDQFTQQKDFFQFLNMLCQTIKPDWFDKWKYTIPENLVDEYRIKTLLFELQETQRKTQDALQQIASKMHNAGVSLQF